MMETLVPRGNNPDESLAALKEILGDSDSASKGYQLISSAYANAATMTEGLRDLLQDLLYQTILD